MNQIYRVNRKYTVLVFLIITLLLQLYAVSKYFIDEQNYHIELDKRTQAHYRNPNFSKIVEQEINSMQDQRHSQDQAFQLVIILSIISVIAVTLIYSKGSKFIIMNIFLLIIGCWVGIWYVDTSQKPGSYNDDGYSFLYILLPYITLTIEHVIIGKKINITNEVRKNEEFIFKQKKDNLNDLIAMNLITQEDYLFKKKQLLKEELYSNKFSSPETLSLEKALKNGIISNEEFAIAFDKIIEKQINKILNTK